MTPDLTALFIACSVVLFAAWVPYSLDLLNFTSFAIKGRVNLFPQIQTLCFSRIDGLASTIEEDVDTVMFD